jgi:hypothetical protein
MRWFKALFNTGEWNSLKNEKLLKEIDAMEKKRVLKSTPSMSEAAYDAMKAAEVAKKVAAEQGEMDVKSKDILHWEGIAAGTIPKGTPPPSQVAYESIPEELRLQMEANKHAKLIAHLNIDEARQHNSKVEKTLNELNERLKGR